MRVKQWNALPKSSSNEVDTVGIRIKRYTSLCIGTFVQTSECGQYLELMELLLELLLLLLLLLLLYVFSM